MSRMIDADKLKSVFNYLCEQENVGTITIEAVEAIIDTAPTVIPEPHWIPVTQDTPTEDGDYWCTFGVETGWFVDWCSWYQGRWVLWTDDTVSEVSNVIAWCKPMEPYKGVTE